jgi:hypothetical protein
MKINPIGHLVKTNPIKPNFKGKKMLLRWMQIKEDEYECFLQTLVKRNADFGFGAMLSDYVSYQEVRHKFDRQGIYIITTTANVDGQPIMGKQRVVWSYVHLE